MAGPETGSDAESVLCRSHRPSRARRQALVVRKLRLGRLRHLLGARSQGAHRVLLPRLRRGARLRKRPARRAVLPLPGSGGALVERYRLHLKRDESLPVGRAHRTLAGRARTGTDACRGEAARARAGMVERPPRPGLGPALARAEPEDPRRARPDRRVLAPALIILMELGGFGPGGRRPNRGYSRPIGAKGLAMRANRPADGEMTCQRGSHER